MTKNTDLKTLKASIPIADLARHLGMYMRSGNARCFNTAGHYRGDLNPSLSFDTDTNRYLCFACGVKGSVIDLYKEVRGIPLSEAIKDLTAMAGRPMPKGQAQTSPSAVYRPEAPQKALTEEITGIYEAFGLACINALTESDRRTYKALDKESYDYLTGPTRGLTAETLRRFKIFSVTDYTATNNYLKKAYGIDALRRAGLINPDPKKNKTNICFWKHKVITPFIEDKKIVFLQGRRIDGEGKLKYLNAFRPVPLFNAETLKGLKAGEKVYICEGVFDAIMLEQNGLPAVAILGVTNFKSSMVKLFKGLEVVLCLDNDDKGHKATKEIKDIFTAQGQSVKAKPLPDGIKDITEYYQKGE